MAIQNGTVETKQQMEDDIAEATTLIDDLNTEIKIVAGKVDTVQNDVVDMKNQLGEVQSVGEATLGEVRSLGEATKKEFGEVKTNVAEVKTAVGALGRELGEVKTEVGEVKTAVGALGRELGEVKTELGEVKTAVNDIPKQTDIEASMRKVMAELSSK